MTPPLTGRVAWCTGAEAGVCRGLALALGGAGAAVVLTGDAKALGPVVADLEANGARAVALDVDLLDPASVDAGLRTAEDELGAAPDVVLHGYVPQVAYKAIPLHEVDDDRWHAVWEGTMQAALFVLQAAHPRLRGRDGRIVLVTPTVSMSGAAGLVPYTTAIEGMRLLAKSAARQWGPDGITVNCLAPAPEHVPVGVDSISVSLAPPALGGPGDAETDLGPVAVFLAGEAGRFVTGLTLSVDGGVWMAP